jgi:hypothetical protein
MSEHEPLHSIAEIAIALAGFSGLVAVFRSGDLRTWLARERFMFWLLLAAALGALFFALLPVALHLQGVGELIVWRISSLLLGAFFAAVLVWALAAHVRMNRSGHRTSRPAAWIAFAPTAAAAAISLVLNGSGLVVRGGAGTYYAGLLLLLFSGVAMFVFLLIFPSGGDR